MLRKISKNQPFNFDEFQYDDVNDRFENQGDDQDYESVPIEPAEVNMAQDVDYFRMEESPAKIERAKPVTEINPFRIIEIETLNSNRPLA